MFQELKLSQGMIAASNLGVGIRSLNGRLDLAFDGNYLGKEDGKIEKYWFRKPGEQEKTDERKNKRSGEIKRRMSETHFVN